MEDSIGRGKGPPTTAMPEEAEHATPQGLIGAVETVLCNVFWLLEPEINLNVEAFFFAVNAARFPRFRYLDCDVMVTTESNPTFYVPEK